MLDRKAKALVVMSGGGRKISLSERLVKALPASRQISINQSKGVCSKERSLGSHQSQIKIRSLQTPSRSNIDGCEYSRRLL
jgi:hypothetical protein